MRSCVPVLCPKVEPYGASQPALSRRCSSHGSFAAVPQELELNPAQVKLQRSIVEVAGGPHVRFWL
jgi:hypothetical protein